MFFNFNITKRSNFFYPSFIQNKKNRFAIIVVNTAIISTPMFTIRPLKFDMGLDVLDNNPILSANE